MKIDSDTPKAPSADDPRDASKKEIFFYAIGNSENALISGILAALSTVAFITLKINPILFGLALAIKTLADALTDPIMAQLTDRTRSRWGRRRPWILVGGVARQIWLILLFLFIPLPTDAPTNQQLAQESELREAAYAAKAKADAAVEETRQEMTYATTDAPFEGAEVNTDATADTLETMAEAPTAGGDKAAALKKTGEDDPNATLKEMKKLGVWESIKVGLAIFSDPASAEQRGLVVYICVALVVFTVFSTMNNTPYWALGIEMAPSYDGRTRVVAYRSVTDKIAGMAAGWMPMLVFMPIFATAVQGMLWYAVLAAVVGIPTTILCVMKTRERTEASLTKDTPNILKSIWLTLRNWHFVKMIFLHQIIGTANGITQGFLPLILILYIFRGNAVQGSFLAGSMQTIQWAIALACIPLAAWACRKYQKHVTMQFAVIWVSVGFIVKFFCLTPDLPYLALILPLFSAFGGTIYYTVLPTMFADITDVDELQTGSRREGMFGAVNAFFGKLNMTTYPIIAGIIMTVSGFEVDKGADQSAEVFQTMIFWASIPPAVLVLAVLLLLHKYPWTRERMAEVQQTLHERHEKRRAEALAQGSA